MIRNAATDRPGLSDRLYAESLRLVLRTPLLPAALGLIGGILLDYYWPLPVAVYALLFVVAGLPLLLAMRAQRADSVLAIVSLALAGLAVGGLRHQVAFWRVPGCHLRQFLHGPQPYARLRGTVATVPPLARPTHDPYSLARADRPRLRFTLLAEQVQTPQGWTRCEGLLSLSLPTGKNDPHISDRIETFVHLRTIPGPANPGEFDWQLYFRRNGIHLAGSAEAATILEPASALTGTASLLAVFRRKCRAVLLENVEPDADLTGLLEAYVAGHRSAVSRPIDEAFRRSGTLHLLAVSGSHVGMIGAFGIGAGMLLFRRQRRAAGLSLIVILFFGLLVEPCPSALRATIVAVLAATALLANRPFSAVNWLAGSTLLLLLIAPADLFSAAFQLSFGVVAALVLVWPAVHRWLFGPRDLAGFIRRRIHRRGSRPWQPAVSLIQHTISMSLTAWLAAGPLLLHHFGQFYVYGAISSVVILSVATLALLLGFAKLLLGLAWPTVGIWMAPLTAASAGWMAQLARWMGNWPGGCIATSPPPAWLILATYALLLTSAAIDSGRRRAVAALFAHSTDDPPVPAAGPKAPSAARAALARRFRPVPGWAILLTVAAVASLYYACCLRPALPPYPRVHVLSVGDGLAVLVRSPGGGVLLYDCGSLTVSRLAETIVLPALRHLGVRRINTVVLSHPNLDHYGGLARLAGEMPIGEVRVGKAFLEASGLPRRLLDDLAGRSIPVHPIARGQTLTTLAPLSAAVLWPPAEPVFPLSDNDSSVVLRIEAGRQSLLLTGDIGSQVQQRLVIDSSPTAIRTDVLVLPHHGNRTTLHEPFVRAAAPQVAIASTGNPDKLGRPAGPAILDTRTAGMITVDLSPVRPRVRQFRQP